MGLCRADRVGVSSHWFLWSSAAVATGDARDGALSRLLAGNEPCGDRIYRCHRIADLSLGPFGSRAAAHHGRASSIVRTDEPRDLLQRWRRHPHGRAMLRPVAGLDLVG